MIIEVKVSTKASKNSVEGFEGEVLKIKCTAVPEKGKANESVIALLAEYYGVPKSRITILRGKTSSRKTIQIN
ncbi:MAG: hypothetical protein K940chlam2_00557 [Chlamydiae bacterium]|nr:hypothetical protein [Chlamydiota bacterium]